MIMYELIIVWSTGEKEKYTYKTIEKARAIESGFLMAFGDQVAFTCINEKGGFYNDRQ